MKLELNHDIEGFYFSCPDKIHQQQYKADIDVVKNAVISLKIRCTKCSTGRMILQCAKEFKPFLGCTEYHKSDCHHKLQLEDKYY
jgi:hypothetical protein